jgi:phospholipase/carboxylesterase
MAETNSPQLIATGPEFYEAGLAFRYQMPDGPGPYPTAVMIHGRAGDEDVMWVFRKVVPRPWLVVAPRAPLADKRLYSWLIQPTDEWPALADFDPAVAALERFLRALPRLYNADPDRIYLMGFSQGAAVSLALALRRPALVRGVAALVGFAPEAADEAVAGRLAGMPVFLAVGLEDETIPYEQSRRAAELIGRAGAELDYREYAIGHKMPAEGIRDLRAWFQARR